MLSTLPVTLPNDGLFGNTLHDFDSLWIYQEPLFTFLTPNEPVNSVFQFDEPPEPVLSNSGSENSNPVLMNHISSPDDMTNQNPNSPTSGSDEPRRPGTQLTEDRKQRRKLSNRESARRSRVRKQQHLENLRNQVTGLLMRNRELTNRLRLVTHHYQLARSENQQLRSESNILRQRIWELQQVILVRELHHQLPATNLITSSWPGNNNVMITSTQGQQINDASIVT
ncbi:DNA-binding transcription factor [Lithospermum erythrorhizon]|uniref:DNA-binding transcription factor n=1 Tax=Lithospermum erythrorhizon TaxID=34254 RepID=A0AAV3P9L0_LITER